MHDDSINLGPHNLWFIRPGLSPLSCTTRSTWLRIISLPGGSAAKTLFIQHLFYPVCTSITVLSHISPLTCIPLLLPPLGFPLKGLFRAPHWHTTKEKQDTCVCFPDEQQQNGTFRMIMRCATERNALVKLEKLMYRDNFLGLNNNSPDSSVLVFNSGHRFNFFFSYNEKSWHVRFFHPFFKGPGGRIGLYPSLTRLAVHVLFSHQLAAFSLSPHIQASSLVFLSLPT